MIKLILNQINNNANSIAIKLNNMDIDQIKQIRRRNLATLVQSEMEKSGFSLYELAKRIGCSYTAVRSWSREEVLPNTGMMIKIARYFGITKPELEEILDRGVKEAPSLNLTSFLDMSKVKEEKEAEKEPIIERIKKELTPQEQLKLAQLILSEFC